MEDCTQDFQPEDITSKKKGQLEHTEDVHNVLKSVSCLVQLPSKKHSKVYFLTWSLTEMYAEYVKVMKKKKKRVLAFSTFCKERLKGVKLQ